MAKPQTKLSFMGDFDKDMDKAGISAEDAPPKYWYSTGNYVLNKIISSSFQRGIPQGRATALVGPSGCLPAGEKISVYEMQTIAMVTPVGTEKVDRTIERQQKNHAVQLTLGSKLTELEYHYPYGINADVSKMDELFESLCEQQAVDISIDQLVARRNEKLLLVSTPDGFQPIHQFFVKQPRQIYRVTAGTHSVRCSHDHLIETPTGWHPAEQLHFGDLIITKSGVIPISEMEMQSEEVVYDCEVAHENQRYWSGGISSHNSGKSYLTANIIKNAQKAGAFILVLDSENALDSEFMEKIGVDTENDYSYRQVDTIGDVIKVVSTFMKKYREAYPDGDGPEVLIVLDSLDMLSTESEVEKFQKGDNSGDQGQRPKQFKAFTRQIVREIKGTNVSMVVTGQVYQATREQLMKGEGVWVVNDAIRYAFSQIILVSKLKLKDDKSKEITGVRIKAQGFKTRFSKPFQEVELEVPYDTGMDPLSGLLETAIALGIVTQKGSRYTMTGSETSWYSKDLAKYADEILERAAQFDSLYVTSGAKEDTEVESQSSVTKRRLGKLAEDSAEE